MQKRNNGNNFFYFRFVQGFIVTKSFLSELMFIDEENLIDMDENTFSSNLCHCQISRKDKRKLTHVYW